MPIVSTIKMAARQYLQLGEDPPGVHLELVNGEVAVSPSPTPEHSNVDTVLRSLLHGHVVKNDLGLLLGDVDTVFGEHDVRRPDLFYFSKKRLHLIGPRAIEGPPDLCVEIVSPSSAVIDRIDKFEQYQTGGVAHYWIVDPKTRTMQGWKLHRGRYVETGSGQRDDVISLPPFPDLDIPMGRLWLPDFGGGKNRKR